MLILSPLLEIDSETWSRDPQIHQFHGPHFAFPRTMDMRGIAVYAFLCLSQRTKQLDGSKGLYIICVLSWTLYIAYEVVHSSAVLVLYIYIIICHKDGRFIV